VSLYTWIEGARPKTLPAAVGPVLVGGGLAWAAGSFAALPFGAALVGALLIQIGTNLANDYSDFVRGADNDERLGFSRVTQSGRLTPRQVWAGAAVAFALAIAVGTYLVARGGWPIVAIGLLSIAAGVCYTGGPWPFGYHGLGDLFVFLFFGPVAVVGTVYVQALEWRADALIGGVGVGALTTAILVVNNLRDRQTDALAGKRTLAVVLGDRGSRAEYAGLLLIGLAVPVAGVALAGWPPGVGAASLASLLAVGPLRTVFGFVDRRDLNGALAGTARVTGLYGALFALGCLT